MYDKRFDLQDQQVLKEVIVSRRDVRGNRFLPTDVPEEHIREILLAGIHAPSVGFSQPWEFLVVDDCKTKQKVKQCFLDANEHAQRKFAADSRSSAYSRLKLEGITEAPVGIAVFYRDDQQLVLGQTSMTEAGPYSVVCAVQNMWLMARALNIGMGWVSILDPVQVQQELNAPKDLKLVAWLCLGFVDYFVDKPELEILDWEKPKKLEQVVRWNSW
ncbi:MAG: 5,6-dimethylbenzimidazole synthase [Zetaproteobacteria bacterium]|nr:5,6-dimethylbenzimidazole synthase [Pseudobdellovibrionaceae bacterium]|tara:strand:- start:1901 stop:2548 length:648 start_codon:yes stop_codon:yes gene_type:complete